MDKGRKKVPGGKLILHLLSDADYQQPLTAARAARTQSQCVTTPVEIVL